MMNALVTSLWLVAAQAPVAWTGANAGWEVWSDVNAGGKHRILYGDRSNPNSYVSDLSAYCLEEYGPFCAEDWNDELSSLVLVDVGFGGRSLTLWEDIQYGGACITFTYQRDELVGRFVNLTDYGWNDRAGSMALGRFPGCQQIDLGTRPVEACRAYDAQAVAQQRQSGVRTGTLVVDNDYGNGSVEIVVYHSDAPSRPFATWTLGASSGPTRLDYNGGSLVLGSDWGIQVRFGNGVSSCVRLLSQVALVHDGALWLRATDVWHGNQRD